MKFLFIGTTLRSLENLGSAPDELQARGHGVLSLLYPLPGDKTHESPLLDQNPRFQLLRHAFTTPQPYMESVRSEPFLQELAERVEQFNPDVIVLAVNTLPFAQLRSDLQGRLTRRRLWVGFQHGLVQRWGETNLHDTCDVFLTFGERDRLRLAPSKRGRSIAVGFPKLDRLAGLPVSSEPFLIYATDARAEAIKPVAALLAELERETGLPVYIRNHPVSKGTYRSSVRRPRDPRLLTLVEAEDPIPALARCSAVITHYSTLGVEALALGKPLVILPLDEALDTFPGLPGLAASLDTPAVMRALHAARTEDNQARQVLRDIVGPDLFHHGMALAQVLEALAGDDGPHDAGTPSLPLRLGVNFAFDEGKRSFWVHGFVLSDPPASRVVLRYRGEVLGQAELAHRRTDLETAFPEYGFVYSGWRLSCDLAEWPAGVLDIEIQDIAGGTSHHRSQIRLPMPV